MEHIDSRIQLNPKRNRAFDLFRQKTKLKGAFDGAFVSILILLGIIGVLTILYLQAAKAAAIQTDQKANLTTNRQVNEASNPAAVWEVEEVDHSHFVSIEGHLQPLTALTMTIDSYDPKAHYTLDLGNGEILEVDKQKTSFSYPGPGIYYPKMEVSFRGETEIIPLEKLWIR